MAEYDSLDESLRHLEYEIAMIVAASRMVDRHPVSPANNTVRPDGYYWANDVAVAYLAGLESALTHARLLDDFFRRSAVPTSKRHPDRFAVEYCTANAWPGMRVLTDDEHDAINKQLSHFTTLRAARRSHRIGVFADRAVAALVELARQADALYRPRLDGIVANVLAERRRVGEPWN